MRNEEVKHTTRSWRTVSWKWWCIVFAVKAVLFLYYADQFRKYSLAELVKNQWAIATNDTSGYYSPLENAAQGEGYDTMCRMPALYPIYVPVSKMAGPDTAYLVVVFFQWFCSAVSCILLALLATSWFRSERIFAPVVLLYAGSSFVSIWDHYLMSDSLCVSLFIAAIYTLSRFISTGRYSLLLLAGALAVWTVFFRQIMVITLPLYAFMLWWSASVHWRSAVKASIVFYIPVALALGAWTTRNYIQYNRVVFLVVPLHECYESYSLQSTGINEFVIRMGGDYMFWSKGSLAEWFHGNGAPSSIIPEAPTLFTSQANADSLVRLRSDFIRFKTASVQAEKDSAGSTVLEKLDRYTKAYAREKPWRYYVLNHLKQLRRFVLPTRLDNLPGPAAASMSVLQFALKAGYFALLLFVTVFGLIGAGLAVIKDKAYLAMVSWPLSFVIVLGFVFGYSEQRYLAPAYPFLLLFALFTLAHLPVLKHFFYPQKV